MASDVKGYNPDTATPAERLLEEAAKAVAFRRHPERIHPAPGHWSLGKWAEVVDEIKAELVAAARTPPPEDERRRDATVSVRFVDLSEGTEVRWWQGVAESIRVGFTAHLSKAEQARMATLLRAALAGCASPPEDGPVVTFMRGTKGAVLYVKGGSGPNDWIMLDGRIARPLDSLALTPGECRAFRLVPMERPSDPTPSLESRTILQLEGGLRFVADVIADCLAQTNPADALTQLAAVVRDHHSVEIEVIRRAWADEGRDFEAYLKASESEIVAWQQSHADVTSRLPRERKPPTV